MKSPQLIRAAADHAQDFIQNCDPNLAYRGLTCMTSLMKIDAKVIAQHRKIIQQCLEHEDPTCVLLAVDLLKSICSERNISNIVDDYYIIFIFYKVIFSKNTKFIMMVLFYFEKNR